VPQNANNWLMIPLVDQCVKLGCCFHRGSLWLQDPTPARGCVRTAERRASGSGGELCLSR
jgi:hypothetical protein